MGSISSLRSFGSSAQRERGLKYKVICRLPCEEGFLFWNRVDKFMLMNMGTLVDSNEEADSCVIKNQKAYQPEI